VAYNIVRPNIASEDLNADALIIHGFVNTDGRFEQLKSSSRRSFPSLDSCWIRWLSGSFGPRYKVASRSGSK